MKKHLKTVSSNFKEFFTKEQPIYPISEVDCEIIVEIIELFKKVGLDDVAGVVDQWKLKKDESIRDFLLDKNTNYKPVIKQGENKNDAPKQTIIKFNNTGLFLNRIIYYDKYDDFLNGKEVYYIVINKIPEGVKQIPLYANMYIPYFNEEKRDRDYEHLEEMFLEEGNIIC